jgi:hypothetical protein
MTLRCKKTKHACVIIEFVTFDFSLSNHVPSVVQVCMYLTERKDTTRLCGTLMCFDLIIMKSIK